MNILIYGAGTIGTCYAYLFSKHHSVDLLVREEASSSYQAGQAMPAWKSYLPAVRTYLNKYHS